MSAQTQQPPTPPPPQPLQTVGAEDYKDVWVYLQREGEHLSKDSTELLAAGRKVADKLGQQLVGILLGSKLGTIPNEAVEFGADRVIMIDDPALADYFSLRIVDA